MTEGRTGLVESVLHLTNTVHVLDVPPEFSDETLEKSSLFVVAVVV